jgi:hypothetical protein
MRNAPLIVSAVLALGVLNSWAQGLKNVIPRNQKPLLRVFPPAPAEQSRSGDGKFVIFTREQMGKKWDFIAGAWECVPSRPSTPITKRVEFCHSSWNADPLLDASVRDESDGMHPRFVRLQVDKGDASYTVNLYDINYRTWKVRCLWQGRQLLGFGCMGDSIFCDSSAGWLLLNTSSGKLNRKVPFILVETDGKYWLVRKPQEGKGCWSYDPVKRQFIAHFGPVPVPEVGFTQSLLSSDGKNRAWVVAPVPKGWRGGTLRGRLILQRQTGEREVSVPIEMQARRGSGFPVPAQDVELQFTPEGQAEFRARKSENDAEDRVWDIDIASGSVSATVKPHLAVVDSELTVLDGVPVPDYLRRHVGKLQHFGRCALAPAFLLHLGILKDQPDYPDCTAGVSRDGRHVLYAAKTGPLSGQYIYGDVATQQIVRWKSPRGLDYRDAQEFVWVETKH